MLCCATLCIPVLECPWLLAACDVSGQRSIGQTAQQTPPAAAAFVPLIQEAAKHRQNYRVTQRDLDSLQGLINSSAELGGDLVL